MEKKFNREYEELRIRTNRMFQKEWDKQMFRLLIEEEIKKIKPEMTC